MINTYNHIEYASIIVIELKLTKNNDADSKMETATLSSKMEPLVQHRTSEY
jgi:hypothetical protein